LNLGSAVDTKTHVGSGPDSSRQNSPHPHGVFVDPSDQYLLVPDLGIDKVKKCELYFRFLTFFLRLFNIKFYPMASLRTIVSWNFLLDLDLAI